jgi:MFS family permease
MSATPVDARRNVLGFLFDVGTFVTGLAFTTSSTVLVSLASQLTNDKTLIGLTGSIFLIAWFLPQLIAASIVRGKPNQKRYVLIASVIGRPMYLLIALWLYFTRAENPLLTLWIVIGGVALFNICDALAGVAWFDMMSRMLSSRTRARVMTLGQIISGILGVIVTFVVKAILDDASIPFPVNYAYLFFGTFTFMFLAFGGLLVLREVPMQPNEQQAETDPNILRSLIEAFRTDGRFRRVLAVRLLTGIEAMAASFYLVFFRENYKLGSGAAGDSNQAVIIGGLLGVAFFGWLAEHYTTRRVVHGSSLLYFVTPLIAAGVAFFQPPPTLAYILFIIVFLFRGAVEHVLLLGTLGYLLDATPERSRALYVGTLNTLGGVVSATPLLGGVWIDSFGVGVFNALPYMLLFGFTAACACVGLLISLKLQKVQTL